MKEMQVIVQVKALRGFVFDGKVVQVGDVLKVPKGFARSLVGAQQAVLVEDVKSGEARRPDAAPLSTQTVPVETPEGAVRLAEAREKAIEDDGGLGRQRGRNVGSNLRVEGGGLDVVSETWIGGLMGHDWHRTAM